MRRMGLLLLSLIVLFSPCSGAEADSTFRCQGHVISVGDTTEGVLEKCGEPDHTEQWQAGGSNLIFQYYDYEHERYIAPKMIQGPLQMERWTYNLGGNKFLRHLLFQNGELIVIETGDRGEDKNR